MMSRMHDDFFEITAEPSRCLIWLPPIAITVAAVVGFYQTPGWLFMWALAFAIWLSFKWVTFVRELQENVCFDLKRVIGYFLWVGMDAGEFFRKINYSQPKTGAWSAAALKTIFGGILTWFFARRAQNQILAGWIGLVGIVFLLHFGAFHLLALAWQHAGLKAEPIMRNPTAATSLSEFWNGRWNLAFHQIAVDLVFRPTFRLLGARGAMLLVFLMSGLIHDLLLSVPARGGYGLPTAYFLVQGVGVLCERSDLGRLLHLREGFPGWLFTLLVTAGPTFLLLHRPFIQNVMIPFMCAIGAIDS